MIDNIFAKDEIVNTLIRLRLPGAIEKFNIVLHNDAFLDYL